MTLTGNRVARQAFIDHWTTHYGSYTARTSPMVVKVREFFEKLENVVVRSPTWSSFPPWKVRLPDIDTSLTKEVSKHDAPDILAALARALIASFGDRTQIFTDASRSTDGKVGIGLMVRAPIGGGWSDIEHSARLTDNVSVYAGELSAIKLALECAKQIFDHTGQNKFAIFSDSLSSVQSIERGQSLACPNLFNQILEALHESAIDTVIVWVPSHIGIFGNEKADRLALIGSQRDTVELDIGFELDDAYHMVDRYVVSEWQTSWNNAPHGAFYRQIEPTVQTRGRLLVFGSRAAETLAHRLRLGRCGLNAYLHQMKLHPTGLCESCLKPETVAHFLLECTGEVATAVKRKCARLGVALTISDVLGNTEIIEVVTKVNRRRL
jgi:ribonuclease HI